MYANRKSVLLLLYSLKVVGGGCAGGWWGDKNVDVNCKKQFLCPIATFSNREVGYKTLKASEVVQIIINIQWMGPVGCGGGWYGWLDVCLHSL